MTDQPPAGPAQDTPRRRVASEKQALFGLDPYLSLADLSQYAGLSVDTLSDAIRDPKHPLPYYKYGTKRLVRVSEYDAWVALHRKNGASQIQAVVTEMMKPRRPRAS